MTYDGTPISERHRLRRVPLLAAAALMLGLAACASGAPADEFSAPAPPEEPRQAPVVQPGAPGTAGQTLTGEQLRAGPGLPHTEADVRFMQNMIHHHAQALEMSRLVPERTDREDIRLLARRIDRSQLDEIALMARWLEVRGEPVPEVPILDEDHGHMMDHVDHAGHADHAGDMDHAHHGEHDPLMAGMLSPEQMERLAGAEGETFDRLFLEAMIYHHEGAIDMVEELFASPGAAQDSEIYQFASHVDADQRIEIGRMYRMLAAGG